MAETEKAESESLPDSIEYWVSNKDMSWIRRYRWAPDTDSGTLTSLVETYTWNYVEEWYDRKRQSHEYEIAPDGTLPHDGRPLREYCNSRVNTLNRKRGFGDADVHKREIE